jgi:hypothetical protein
MSGGTIFAANGNNQGATLIMSDNVNTNWCAKGIPSMGLTGSIISFAVDYTGLWGGGVVGITNVGELFYVADPGCSQFQLISF